MAKAAFQFHIERSPFGAVDEALLDSATAAVQSQERFLLELNKTKNERSNGTLLNSGESVLNTMRSMKSTIEGTTVDLPRPLLREEPMRKLRSLLLMHMPRTITDQVKQNFAELIEEVFADTSAKVIHAGLCFCPWYVSTQPELGQQAKHNSLTVIFTNPAKLVLSPANAHSKEQTEVIEHEGFLYAVEAHHFAKYLVRGKGRMVELLFAPAETVLVTSPEWSELLQIVDITSLLGLKPFLEQCRGQAVGAVAKKSKKTMQMKLNDGATLSEFCECFRLLQNAIQAIRKQTLDAAVDLESVGQIGKDAHSLICKMYQHEADGRTKEDLFDLLMALKHEVDIMMKTVKFTNPNLVEEQISSWLLWLRAGRQIPIANPGMPEDQREHLEALMAKVGGPIANIDPSNIVMVVRAGSYLYGLSTPESDIDYLVIYVEPTQNILSSVKKINENKENRGPHKEIEYGAYEARLFAEMLLKGSVVIAEVVFVDDVEYASESWKALCSERHLFATEHLILQYFGLISNNMHTIENNKYKDTPREKKLFYQIFHKLWSLEALLEGHAPPVRCTGEVKDFIMSIRRGPLEGDLSRDCLYKRAREQIQALRLALAARTKRLPENADLSYLTDWLMALRGWDGQRS